MQHDPRRLGVWGASNYRTWLHELGHNVDLAHANTFTQENGE